MKTREIVVSVSVGLLGVASAVLGFIAEARKLTPDDIEVSRTRCVYPKNPAFELALCALVLLVVARIIVLAAGGCCGCCRPRTTGASETKRVVGIVAAVLSWIAALSAGAFYLQGAAWNAPLTRNAFSDGCYILKGGVFTRAAVLSLVAAALGILSYILLTRAPAQAWPAAAPRTAATGTEPKPGGP